MALSVSHEPPFMSTVDFAIEADDVHNPSMATGKPMPDSEVIKLRLKRSLLEEIRELTKGAAFTMQEVLRAAIQLGLPHLKSNPKLVTKSEAGLLPKSLGQSAKQNPNTPPPDPGGEHGPTMEELIQGKDEWWHIRELEHRLKKLEEGFARSSTHEKAVPDRARSVAGELVKSPPSPEQIKDYFLDATKALASRFDISQEEAHTLLEKAAWSLRGFDFSEELGLRVATDPNSPRGKLKAALAGTPPPGTAPKQPKPKG